MAEPGCLPPTGVDIMSTYGPFLIGSAFYTTLWGISCMQLFIYFYNYEKDHVGLKSLVAFVFSLDTANVIMSVASVFPVLVTHWGSLAEMATISPFLRHHSWLSTLVSSLVQGFFAYRIHRLGNGGLVLHGLLALVALLAIYTFAAGITYTVWLYRGNAIEIVAGHVPIAIVLSARAAGAAADIIIAFSLIYQLLTKGKSDFSRSRRLIYRLVMLTVSTGFWTAVIAIVDLALVARFPHGMQYLPLEFPLSALYVNTLLANLNARIFLRHTDISFNSLELKTPSNGLAFRSANTSGNSRMHGKTEIHVDTSHLVRGDGSDYAVEYIKSTSSDV